MHIKDFVPGSIEGFYLLKSAVQKTASNGKPYLQAVIKDKTGEIPAVKWSYDGALGEKPDGKIIKIRGSISEYKGSLQVTIDLVRLAREGDPYVESDLIASAPINADDALKELWDIINHEITDEEYRAIVTSILSDDKLFSEIPAAKSVHHAFRHGLLMHTRNMAKTAVFLSSIYPVVNKSLLIAGTILHDVAKEYEFALNEVGLVSDYTANGRLLGHLVMGAQLVSDVCTRNNIGMNNGKCMLLQHMILSHHGQPEFGAAVVPMCAEAELLSLIDLIDARMETYSEALESVPQGQFSGKLFALGNKQIYQHTNTSERA